MLDTGWPSHGSPRSAEESRRGPAIALLGALSLLPATSGAWSDPSHEIICEIALAELNPDAKAEVGRLIDLDNEFEAFPRACTWPDHPRRRRPEHFANYDRSTRKIHRSADGCPLADKCLLTAIPADFAVLADPDTPDEDKLRALKFLGHWVGDIHQPLHVSFQDDRGGNFVKETGPCEPSNLHSVWDRCIVEKGAGGTLQEIAAALREDITEEQRELWAASSLTEWANESFQIAISPDTEYCIQSDGACVYDEANRTFEEGKHQRVVLVDSTYINRQMPIVAERLQRAAIRLAALLDSALGGSE